MSQNPQSAIDNVISSLKIVKRVLAGPFSIDMSMRIKIGQVITGAIEQLEQFEIQENNNYGEHNEGARTY